MKLCLVRIIGTNWNVGTVHRIRRRNRMVVPDLPKAFIDGLQYSLTILKIFHRKPEIFVVRRATVAHHRVVNHLATLRGYNFNTWCHFKERYRLGINADCQVNLACKQSVHPRHWVWNAERLHCISIGQSFLPVVVLPHKGRTDPGFEFAHFKRASPNWVFKVSVTLWNNHGPRT